MWKDYDAVFLKKKQKNRKLRMHAIQLAASNITEFFSIAVNFSKDGASLRRCIEVMYYDGK